MGNSASADVSRVWAVPDLVRGIVSLLPRNEVPCSLRLVSKAEAAFFHEPGHKAIHMSLPLPPHVLVRLPLRQRRELLCAAAASGSLANMEAVLATTGCLLTAEVFEAAAAAGQLEMCQWLLQRGCPVGEAFVAAARAGHLEVCEWLLGHEDPRAKPTAEATRRAVVAAAHSGHVALLERLMPLHAPLAGSGVWEAIAHGCDLLTLQRLWEQAAAPSGSVLAAACGSPTPDWSAKAEWLEAHGCRIAVASAAYGAAAALPNGEEAVRRLQWLRQRGYPCFAWGLTQTAFTAGCDSVLHVWLYSEGLLDYSGAGGGGEIARKLAQSGRVARLQLIYDRVAWFCKEEPPPLDDPSLRLERLYGVLEAALEGNGQLSVMQWAVEKTGNTATLLGLQRQAATTGNLELLAWVVERGCKAQSAGVFAAAAEGGCEEVLEWLRQRGCDMGASGEPYIRAGRNGDLATMGCLRRLGCRWGPHGETFARCVADRATPSTFRVPVLTWLLEAGCPVDWDAALAAAARDWWGATMVAWLQEQRQQRQG